MSNESECKFVRGEVYKDGYGDLYKFVDYVPELRHTQAVFVSLKYGALTLRTVEGKYHKDAPQYSISPYSSTPPFEPGKKYKTRNGKFVAEYIGSSADGVSLVFIFKENAVRWVGLRHKDGACTDYPAGDIIPYVAYP